MLELLSARKNTGTGSKTKCVTWNGINKALRMQGGERKGPAQVPGVEVL